MAITFKKSDKIIFISIPDTEVTIQELVYAIRDYEDSQMAMDIFKIADASGKENLGGGVSVGITLKLLDWKLQFEPRSGPTWIVCNVTGGNLVAVNDAGVDVNPIEPSAFVTVTKTASSSATTTDIQSIRTSIFGGVVYVDSVNGTPGSLFPQGTLEFPVNNWGEATGIANIYNIRVIRFIEDYTFSPSNNLDSWLIEGTHLHVTLFIPSGTSTDRSIFEHCSLSGSLDGVHVHLTNCIVLDLSDYNGDMRYCTLEGTIIITGDENNFINCNDGLPGLGVPIIDAGTNGSFGVWGYNGGLKIINKSSGGPISVNLSTGRLILDSTVTGGSMLVKGVGLIENSSSADVNTDGLVNKGTISDQVWDEKLADHTGSVESAGYALDNVSAGASPAIIAAAVWDKSLSEHTSSEASAASRIGFIYGLMQSNFRMVDMVYDSNKLMTAAKLRIYTNSIDADADTNYLKQWLLTAVYTDGKLTDYIVKE